MRLQNKWQLVDPAPLCDLISHITCRDSASVNRTGIWQESFRIRTRWATSKSPQKQRTKRKQRGKIVTCGPKFCLFDFLYCIFRAFGLPVVLDRGVIFELSPDARDAQFHRICLILAFDNSVVFLTCLTHPAWTYWLHVVFQCLLSHWRSFFTCSVGKQNCLTKNM